MSFSKRRFFILFFLTAILFCKSNLIFAQRPILQFNVSNSRFVVHYNLAEEVEVANLILEYAQYSYERQCEDLGWPEPPSDFENGGDNRYDSLLYCFG